MKIRFSDNPPSNVRLYARILNQGDMPADLDAALVDGANAARFKGSAGQVFETFSMEDGALRRIALAGAGETDGSKRRLDIEKAGAALSAKYLASGETDMVIDLGHADLSGEEAAAALLGLRLRAWRMDTYRTKLPADKRPSLHTVHVVGAPDGTKDAWAEAEAVAKGVEFTRTLVTEPANKLYPDSFVAMCEEAFKDTGAQLVVLDNAAMEKLGMGALLGVGQGSDQPSRILAIRWNGGAESEKPTVFVGKGVTFDTGGISLKPPPGMEDMKWDMGGAGAVA
ncbi:MAG: M17 family peptidase N-terminal domain-containing protein, partial [Parvibaculum sp.]